MKDDDKAAHIASTRLVNSMINEGFLPKGENAERFVFSPDAIRSAAPAFFAHVVEVVPGGKDKCYPWKEFPPGPRWKRIPNFAKKTLDELRTLAGVTEVPLKQVAVLVPEDRANDLISIAAEMRQEQSAPETGTKGSSGGETGARENPKSAKVLK